MHEDTSNIALYLHAGAAAYLMLVGTTVSAKSAPSAVIYNWLPLVIGMLSAFYVLAQYKGWPA